MFVRGIEQTFSASALVVLNGRILIKAAQTYIYVYFFGLF